VVTLGGRAVRLYPLYHPAAALRTPATLNALREDFARIRELLSLPEPRQPPLADVPELAEALDDAADSEPALAATPPDQLGLF
jgi:DNA polymerase